MTLIYLSTQAGSVPTFVAFDQYSHYCFFVEPVEVLDEAAMMKAVGKLMNHEDFQRIEHKGFSLLVDFGDEIQEELNLIAQEHEGSVSFEPEEFELATEVSDLFNNIGRVKGDFIKNQGQ
tara:strand:- start:5386 stop:5745 length:360 start_codon:yes stop_codon:yes gene_type:complete